MLQSMQNLKMKFKPNISCLVAMLLFVTIVSAQPIKITTFKQLAEYHCEQFPVQILYRLSSGTLAQQFGPKYSEIDCYVRQFVNQDGQNKQQMEDEESQSQDEASKSQNEQIFPQIDPIVEQYSKGIRKCIPGDINPVDATYKIWRFYRYLFQHDYAYEWMRAKVRSGLGYQAQKPSSWMDGQQNQKRLRLDKLFSNQFYDYIDKLMFKDFLFPLMTFLKKNVVVGLEGSETSSGNSMILQFIESKNIHPQFFKPIIFKNQANGNQIFTYTIPGIPLFFGGSSVDFIWAFTGVLIDRSNVEQIQTIGNKFYHHGIEQWIRLNNVSIQIPVKDQQPYTCKFMHSSYGTLYEKHNGTGKISQYIARWHQDEPKVRNLFTEVYNLVLNTGKMARDFDFPFNSMMVANRTGLFNYLCQQYHPSYFIYPDLASQPDALTQRWITDPKKGVFVVGNTHLTTIKQESYLNKEILSPLQEQIIIEIRRLNRQKISRDQLWDNILSISTDPLVKKRKQHLIFMYRKSKFVFFPDQQIRKQCDQLISILEKWDHNLESQIHSPVFILWDYFFRDYTMNHVSSSKFGAHAVKHRVLTDSYWTNQPQLWKKVISYGECDSNKWHEQGWDVRLNGTGLNSTCFFNVLRGLNKTRQILRNEDGSIDQNVKLSRFKQKKIIDLSQNYKGNDLQEAFGNYYSRNLAFVAELDNDQIRYMHGYRQVEETTRLKFSSSAPASQTIDQTEKDFGFEL